MIDENNENKLIEGEDFYYTPEGYKCFYRKTPLKKRLLLKVDVAIVPMVDENGSGKKSRNHQIVFSHKSTQQ
jgi:hypothetical protein